MRYKLVADSSANVYSMPQVDFAVVPLTINAEGQEFVDDGTLDVAAMESVLKQTKGRTGTSCPNVFDWLTAFEGADRVFAVPITRNMSGSHNACVQAAAEYERERPGAKVYVVDSLSAGPELGLILDKIAAWIGEGKEAEQIWQDIQAYQKRTHLSFSLGSLNNLARNGRVNPAVAKIAGVLGIRIVGVASDEGTLEQRHKSRGEQKALEQLYQDMLERGYAGGLVRIANCFNDLAARTLEAMIRGDFPGATVLHELCGGLCSFYAEHGGLLVGYEG